MRPLSEEHPAEGGPVEDPDDEPVRAGEDEDARLRRARGALRRLAGELRDTDEVLDRALDGLGPPGGGDGRD